MNRTTGSLFLAILFLVALGLSCNSNDDENAPLQAGTGCTPATGTYYLTPTSPAGPDYTITDEYSYHSKEADQGGGTNCDLVIYDDCPPDPDNSYFQFNFGVGCALQKFEAGKSEYSFNGDWLRPYNQGTGPFATGFYTNSDTGEQGTFEFYEEGRTKTP